MKRIVDAIVSGAYWTVTIILFWILALIWLPILALGCVSRRVGDQIRKSVRDPYERRWRDE